MIRRHFLKIGAALPLGLLAGPERWIEGAFPAVDTTMAGAARTLPQWFLAARVQGHTRLGPRFREKPEFTAATALFEQLGVKVMTRHVKMADEPPGWPTKAGKGEQRDYAREVIEAAHSRGLKIITYNWIMSEAALAKEHPDWICHDHRGKPTDHHARGVNLDITGPYREVILTRLLELAERGADGYYFDNEHLPREGCWGSQLEKDFERATGKSAPTRVNNDDPLYNSFIDFQAQRLADTFEYWQTEVHRRYPNVVFVASATTLVGLFGRAMNTKFLAVVDSAKTEYDLALRPGITEQVFRRGGVLEPRDDIRIALGWTVLRDGAYGRPPHVGASGFPNGEHSRAFAAAVITWGGIATIDLDDKTIVDSSPASLLQRSTVSEAAELGRAVGPTLAQMRPMRWAAVHFPEGARDRRAGKFVAAAREVLAPMTQAFGALIDSGVPAGVVTDRQLSRGELAEYRVLFLPAPNELTREQETAVEAFRRGGGLVIGNRWSWNDERSVTASRAEFMEALAPVIAEAPARVRRLPAGAHGVGYRNEAGDAIAVAISNRFMWIQEQAADRSLAKQPRPRPSPLQAIEIQTRTPFSTARDAVTGASLRTKAGGGGTVATVPSIDTLALVVFGK